MATLDQMVYRIRNAVSGGQSTNNSDISSRQVAYDIHQMRSLLIRREWRNLDPFDFFQSINITFSHTDKETDSPNVFINNIALKTDTDIHESDQTIPKVVPVYEELPLRLETSLFDSISIVGPHQLRLHAFNKFSSVKPIASLYGNKLYILLADKSWQYDMDNLETGNDITDTIEQDELPVTAIVQGIFEDPEAVEDYTTDQDYPASNQMQTRIIESLIKRYYVQQQTPEDNTLNLEDDGMVSN